MARPKKEVEAPKEVALDPKKEYTFVSNGTFRTLPKGKEWVMLGDMAQMLTDKGYGNVKD